MSSFNVPTLKSLLRWVDEYLDPYRDVHPVNPDEPVLKGLRSFRTFVLSYKVAGSRVEIADIVSSLSFVTSE